MSVYYVAGLSDEITAEVRTSMRSPQFGHPVSREIATGTGPCRACLNPFRVGVEERLLFTYRPDAGPGSLAAPGPVFIHARQCTRYVADHFPTALASFALIVEARARNNRVPLAHRATGSEIDKLVEQLFADPDVDYVYIRHGDAGCHIARIQRHSGGLTAD
jgi:hypothetical protein